MPDVVPPSPSGGSVCGEIYPISPTTATSSLEEVLDALFQRDGSVSFPTFMEAVLYHPDWGYYARGMDQTGRGGDFFTSVSVGPLFGNILARRFLKHWQGENRPRQWRILELGAHDGTLAGDVLSTMQQLDGEAFSALEYVISEPLPRLRTAQGAKLSGFGDRVRWVCDPSELAHERLPGIAFGNELLDALPFHVVRRSGGRWLECAVTMEPGRTLCWLPREVSDPLLAARLDLIGDGFPEGYQTEVRTGMVDLLTKLSACFDRALMIWPDYGFARPEYYHPDRVYGTLRTFSKHQAGSDPFLQPGRMDITAHVDFTDVAESALACGGRPLAFQDQSAWIIQNAREWLLEQEGVVDPSWVRQFQTLTHPAQLGAAFHVLELTWDPQRSPSDQTALKHRLALGPES